MQLLGEVGLRIRSSIPAMKPKLHQDEVGLPNTFLFYQQQPIHD